MQAEIDSLHRRLEAANERVLGYEAKMPRSGLAESQNRLTQKHAEPDKQTSAAFEVLGDQQVLSRARALLSTVKLHASRREQAGAALVEIRNDLLEEISRNPVAYQFVLDAFVAEPDSNFGQLLMPILGQMRDPAAVTAAVDLVRAGATREARIIGLNLLGQLGIDNAETHNVVREVLRTESDPGLLSSALAALEPSIVGPDELSAIHDELQPLLRHHDAEVRRRSLQALARWSFDNVGTEVILNALSDPSADVRAEAAYALGQLRVDGDRTRTALMDRIIDSDEDWNVRQQAWMALQKLPMDDVSFQVHQAFKEEWEERNENAGIR